jgi:hypothetical protein
MRLLDPTTTLNKLSAKKNNQLNLIQTIKRDVQMNDISLSVSELNQASEQLELKPIRYRWTAEDDMVLYEMMADGAPYEDIAFQLNRTKKSVEMRAFKLRQKLRQANLAGPSKVMSKRAPSKRKGVARRAVAKKKVATKKPAPSQPEKDSDIPYSGGALFEERMGHLMVLGAAGAAGAWLVLLLVALGVLQVI